MKALKWQSRAGNRWCRLQIVLLGIVCLAGGCRPESPDRLRLLVHPQATEEQWNEWQESGVLEMHRQDGKGTISFRHGQAGRVWEWEYTIQKALPETNRLPASIKEQGQALAVGDFLVLKPSMLRGSNDQRALLKVDMNEKEVIAALREAGWAANDSPSEFGPWELEQLFVAPIDSMADVEGVYLISQDGADPMVFWVRMDLSAVGDAPPA